MTFTSGCIYDKRLSYYCHAKRIISIDIFISICLANKLSSPPPSDLSPSWDKLQSTSSHHITRSGLVKFIFTFYPLACSLITSFPSLSIQIGSGRYSAILDLCTSTSSISLYIFVKLRYVVQLEWSRSYFFLFFNPILCWLHFKNPLQNLLLILLKHPSLFHIFIQFN